MPYTLLSAFSALALSAAPAPVGQIAGVEGDVMIMRADETVTAQAGDALFEGDRVVAKTAGAATLEAFGCSTEVSDLGLVNVTPAMCGDDADVSFGYAQGAGWAGLSNGAKTLIFFAGTAGTIAIVNEVVTEDDDDEPASP